jgi:hypothetical protein
MVLDILLECDGLGKVYTLVSLQIYDDLQWINEASFISYCILASVSFSLCRLFLKSFHPRTPFSIERLRHRTAGRAVAIRSGPPPLAAEQHGLRDDM